MNPKDANTDEEIARCFGVMSELRTQLKRDEFVTTVRSMEAAGFQLAYIEDNGDILAVAGYRIYTNLLMGRNLYVDDLATSKNARSRGIGESLLHWLGEKAVNEGCELMRLDSATTRGSAHRFYFNQGFSIGAFHFVRQLIPSDDTP